MDEHRVNWKSWESLDTGWIQESWERWEPQKVVAWEVDKIGHWME